MVIHYWRAILRAMRHGFRFGPPPQSPQALLRVATGIVLGTVLGYVLDQEMLCVWVPGSPDWAR
ncbi:hypothetical protein [Streptomyces sp. NPDC058385]|uniref:hypothetical protein n=1 Tax=Streptomyces sp. NPDC058385 TaxID=3346473 RepID=UPI003669391F